MEIKVESRFLGDVVVLVPDVFQDTRGFFMETFRKDQFIDNGLPTEFVQDNHSRSTRGVLRGLHFQWGTTHGEIDARYLRKARFLSLWIFAGDRRH